MNDKVTVTSPAVQQISAASQAVANLFRSAEVGDVITYEMVNAAAGCDVRQKRYIASTARNRVMVDDGVHIAAVYGVGFRRLSPAEAAETLDSDLSRARNAARKGAKRASHISVLDVPTDKRGEFVMRRSLCELIKDGTGSKGQAKLLAVANTQPADTAILAMKQTLDALKSGG
jgi:hypothetical protein